MMVNIHSRLEFNEIHISLRKSNGFYSSSLALKENILAGEAKKSIICKVCGSVKMSSNTPIESIEEAISF